MGSPGSGRVFPGSPVKAQPGPLGVHVRSDVHSKQRCYLAVRSAEGQLLVPLCPGCSHLSRRVLIWAVMGWEDSGVLWVQSLTAVFPSTVVFRVK